MSGELLAYRLLSLTGQFDNERSFLLDNQIQHGEVGYQLLSPFVSTDGETVLVNRGWLKGFADRRLPALPQQAGQVEIVASIYVPVGEAVLLEEDQWAWQWPIVIQSIDVGKAQSRLEAELFPYAVRMQAGYPGALAAEWPAVNTAPEKHSGYAVQWFFMAFALAGFWVYTSLSRPPVDADGKLKK